MSELSQTLATYADILRRLNEELSALVADQKQREEDETLARITKEMS